MSELNQLCPEFELWLPIPFYDNNNYSKQYRSEAVFLFYFKYSEMQKSQLLAYPVFHLSKTKFSVSKG